MRASELPYDVKQQFLQQIEIQLGSDVYRRAVGSLGEDGLIDSVLAKQEEARPRRSTWWGSLAATLFAWLVVYPVFTSLVDGNQYVLAIPVFLFWLWLISR